jgi:hypothetical protein
MITMCLFCTQNLCAKQCKTNCACPDSSNDRHIPACTMSEPLQCGELQCRHRAVLASLLMASIGVPTQILTNLSHDVMQVCVFTPHGTDDRRAKMWMTIDVK